MVMLTKRGEKMPNIYVRDVPRDLYYELKKMQSILGCKTWVSFLYEVARRVKQELENEGHIIEWEV